MTEQLRLQWKTICPLKSAKNSFENKNRIYRVFIKNQGIICLKRIPLYKIAKQIKMLKSKVILQNIFFYETYSTACIPHYNPPKSGLSLRVQKIYKDFATMKQKPKN